MTRRIATDYPKASPLTTTLWQRLLQRVRALDAGAYLLLKACPVPTVEPGPELVLVVECPRSWLFDLMAQHRRAIQFAAGDVLDCDVIVWRRLAPDARCVPISEAEWAAQGLARRRRAAGEGRYRGEDALF